MLRVTKIHGTRPNVTGSSLPRTFLGVFIATWLLSFFYLDLRCLRRVKALKPSFFKKMPVKAAPMMFAEMSYAAWHTM